MRDVKKEHLNELKGMVGERSEIQSSIENLNNFVEMFDK